MCRSCGLRHNSVVTDTSPGGQVHDGSLDSISSAGFTHAGWRTLGSGVSSGGDPCVGVVVGGGAGSGRVGGGPGGLGSPDGRIAGLTMKEYDQHLARLNKENFALKLRIYFLEEKQGQAGQAAPQLYKANIELKVENEALKRQVFDKQQLLSQASSALSQLEEEYKEQLNALLLEHENRVQDMQDNILQLQKTVDDYADRCQELENDLREQQRQHQQNPMAKSSTANHPASELSQLCDLAFPSADSTNAPNSAWNAALWNTTDASLLWGPPAAANASALGGGVWSAQASHLPAGGEATSAVSATKLSTGMEAAVHQSGVTSAADGNRKLSSDSQSSAQYGGGPACAGGAATDTTHNNNNTTPSPVHVNTTNVTNNNINNTLPNTSNNLQQMQYQQQQHPHSSQYQNTSSESFNSSGGHQQQQQPPNPPHQQHFHHYHQQLGSAITGGPGPVTDNAVPAATSPSDASGKLLPSEQQAATDSGNGAAMTLMMPPPSLQGVLGLGSAGVCPSCSSERVQELEQQITQLKDKLESLHHQLQHKDDVTVALQEDLDNLKRELQEKEGEVLEREEKVESLSQELETRHRQLQSKEGGVLPTYSDLDKVEPMVSVKVQEIVERDRLIEQKIEQIEQQNKILVEIQITLDEKQKQIAELEASLAEARERAAQLEQDYDKSCGAISGFMADLATRDKEMVAVKKEVKKRDRRIKDLVAELKETLDMLGKAKWEAETGGSGEDSVKEMVEEENERLWADMEQKKCEVERLKDELTKAVESAAQQSAALGLCQETLRHKDETEKLWQKQIDELASNVKAREALVQENNKQVEQLKTELNYVKKDLEDKMLQLTELKIANSGSDGSEHSLQLEKLRHKLEVCKSERAREIDALKGQLELKNSDIIHLQSQLISEAKQGEVVKKNVEAATTALQPTTCAQNNFDVTSSKSRTYPVHYEPLQVSITAGLLSAVSPAAGASSAPEQRPKQQQHTPQPSLDNTNPEAAPDTDPGGRLAGAPHTLQMVPSENAQPDDDGSSISKFQRQLEILRTELRDTKEAIGSQMSEIDPKWNHQDIIRKYRIKCSNLKKRLGDSNHSCELLKNRLEELAEFLEQILDMDERGLIDLSRISGFSRGGLYKSLNDSRALSQTLSQSLLLGMDTLMEEEMQWDEDAEEMEMTASVLPDDSSYYVADADMTMASSVGHRTFASIAEAANLNDTNYHNLVNKLCSEVENKAKKLDDILAQLAVMSGDLGRREKDIVTQSDMIIDLHEQVRQLEERLTVRDGDEHSRLSPVSDAVEVGCQTLLAMAPRQSVSSLPDLSTSYLSSCSETFSQSNGAMEPLIEGEILKSPKTSEAADEHLKMLLLEDKDKSLNNIPTQDSNVSAIFMPSLSVLTRSGSDVVCGLKSSNRSVKAGSVSQGGCVSAGEADHVPSSQVPASPSESETWSEPDRNVSLARIGLETCTLAASPDRSLSRPRPTRVTAAALSSESDTEECQVFPDDNASLLSAVNLTGQLSAALKSIPKRKSDASEVRRLATRLRATEHLNVALKAELNIYHCLSNQLSSTTDQQQSDDQKQSPVNNNSSKTGTSPHSPQEQSEISTVALSNTRATLPLSNLKKLRRFTSSGEEGLALAAPLLQEIRSLRTKLEESISNNDQLRDQLEAAVLSCSKSSDGSSNLTHLTAALLNAQEMLHVMRERLAFSQLCEQLQVDRCSTAELKTEEEIKLSDEIRTELEATQKQVAATMDQLELANIKWTKQNDSLQFKCSQAEASLEEAKRVHEESEAVLQDRLMEVTKACEESENQLKEQHEAINEVYASLQETSHWPHLNHLHSALQASETQVLKVTRDRLVLLGEKSKLQAQLMSAQAQTSLLQDSLCEDEPVPPMLHQQLAQVQTAVRNLQHQCCRLQTLNASLAKDKERVEEKLAGYKAVEKLVKKSDITLESVGCDGGQRGGRGSEGSGAAAVESRLNNVALQQLQRNYSLLQEDYTHLQKLYSLVQDDEKNTCDKLHVTNSALQKAQLNIDALNEQYQDKMQSLQKECSEKLLEAEKQVSEVQERFQERMRATENKLDEAQKKSQEKLVEIKNSSEEEISRLEMKLHALLQQLDTERRAADSLRAQLRNLRQQGTSVWSDDKENVHSNLSNSNIRYSRSPSHQAGNISALKSSNPIPTKSRSGSSPSVQMNSPPYSGYHSHSLGASYQYHNLSSSNLSSSFVRSPVRTLHFSDPNLGGSGGGGGSIHHYTTVDDELDEMEEITAGDEACGSDSPDLGLGSSDNGQMSSLERVMGHNSSSARAAEHSAASFKFGGSHHESSGGCDERGSRTSLRSPRHHNIGVIISGRSSLPPVVSAAALDTDLLCSVPDHSSLATSNQDLSETVDTLKQQLHTSDARLQEALQQLKAATARKQTVERAICRQLTKTHQVLRRAKGNLQQQQQRGTDAAAGNTAAADERRSSVD